MGRKFLVLLLSIVASFGLMSGGYGKWTDEVTIIGEIDIIPDPEVVYEMESQLSSIEAQVTKEIELQRIAENIRIDEGIRLLKEQEVVNLDEKKESSNSETDNSFENTNQNEVKSEIVELDENDKETMEIDEIDRYDIEKDDELEDSNSEGHIESKFDLIDNINE